MSDDLSVRRPTQTPTVTAGAYSANEAVGGKLTFADAVDPGASPGALLESVTILDLAKQDIQLDLVLFDRDFTATTDNAAFDPSDADAAHIIGVVKVTDYADFADSSVATKAGIGLPLKCASGSTIYGQLVTRGTPTYAAVTDITVTLGIVRG